MLRILSKPVARTTAAAASRWSKLTPLLPSVTTNARTISSSSLPEESDRLIVIGSGVAGCSAALVAAEHGLSVTLLTAGSNIVDNNSNWAQGGIIYENTDPGIGDSAQALERDIHVAGAGLCDASAVEKLAAEGPNRVRQLLLDPTGTFANVPFDADPVTGKLSVCLEASHSAARILYYADSSGAVITEHITAAAVRHPNINIMRESVVTDLCVADGTCVGVQRMDTVTGGIVPMMAGKGVVLASGGLGSIYEHTTNPPGFNALGSSVALATRIGAETADLEYVQFHPTSLYIPGEARFLLTEALRGEGAILRDKDGRAFAKDFHPDGELAPRDVVARGVFAEAKNNPNGHVYLDVSHLDATFLKSRFPTINKHLSARGIDMTSDFMPVVPASHYTCGGVSSDLHGRTTVPGLYVAGEAARTGLHGGNRLASTSLLEGLVWGASVADFVASEEGQEVSHSLNTLGSKNINAWPEHQSKGVNQEAERNSEAASTLLSQLRKTMWDNVGVERTSDSTAFAAETLKNMQEEAEELFQRTPTVATVAVRDAACAGEAVATAANLNKTSAGAHFIVDALEKDEVLSAAS